MKVNQNLINATIAFLNNRYDSTQEDVVVAGAYTESGALLFGVATNAFVNAACLCAETGSICEAQKLNVKLTATVCIIREKPNGSIKFLTPCGICQKRLLYFGNNLTVAIPLEEDASKWAAKTLKELQSNHWYNAFKTG